jgi:hypothetical protein
VNIIIHNTVYDIKITTSNSYSLLSIVVIPNILCSNYNCLNVVKFQFIMWMFGLSCNRSNIFSLLCACIHMFIYIDFEFNYINELLMLLIQINGLLA